LKSQTSAGSSGAKPGDNREKVLDVPSKVLVPLHWRKRIRAAPSIAESFYHAFNGVWLGLRTERNLRIHFLMGATIALLAFVLKVDYVGCIALALAIGLVLTVEFINTALEHLVDLASHRTYHVSAKAAKDTAAAAVLMASCCAIFIGAIVLGPRLMAVFQHLH
jgi:diacylglycerol kinase